MLLSALLVVVLVGGTPGPSWSSEVERSSFSHLLAQGRYFLEEGLFNEAEANLSQAALDSTALEQPEVFVLLARCRLALGELDQAIEDIRRAGALFKGDLAPEDQDLFAFLTTRFGKVLVVGATDDGALRPEPVSPILDPEVKRLYRTALQRLDAGPADGKSSVYLPVGAYAVGGHVVEVRADGSVRMDLRPGVGRAAAGVYGEQGEGSTSPLQKGLSKSALLAVRVGAHLFAQQKEPAFSVRLLFAMEAPIVDPRFTLRLGGGLALAQLEQILGVEGTIPPGVLPFVHLGTGFQGPLPGRMTLSPFFCWNIGYAHPSEALMPSSYVGPFHYLVHGPDLEIRWTLPSATDRRERNMRVWMDLSARFSLRETWPFGSLGGQDLRPHLNIGGGVDLGLRLGP